MNHRETSVQHFLLAAKHCEIQGLEQLARSCALVTGISRLVHALQKERGLSNVFLASSGHRLREQRYRQLEESQRLEQELRAFFAQLDVEQCHAPGHVRQFSRIAAVLQELDTLAAVRAAIDAQQLEAAAATRAFSHLIGNLLAVVFEAADSAADPGITRLLIAMFNLMQGKELAGQERAWGASGFAAGQFGAEHRQKISELAEGQDRCFEVFAEFAGQQARKLWERLCAGEAYAELRRLRQVVNGASPEHRVPSAFSEVWYAVATSRIDGMRDIEEQLATELQSLSERKLRSARNDLKDHRRLLQQFNPSTCARSTGRVWVDARLTGQDAGAAEPLEPGKRGIPAGRSLFQLVQDQAARLQRLGDELNEARRALEERKRIERAKGVLMQHRQLSEEAAYRQLRQAAMEQNRRLAEVAEQVIALAGLLEESAQTER